MKQIISLLSLSVLILLAACYQKIIPAAVPKVTYGSDVQQLIQLKCSPCHLPSKGGFKQSFENFANAQKFATAMVTRIELDPTARGFMPFKNAKLSADEINVFKNWVRDGLLEK